MKDYETIMTKALKRYHELEDRDTPRQVITTYITLPNIEPQFFTCRSCSHDLQGTENFCPSCGQRLQW